MHKPGGDRWSVGDRTPQNGRGPGCRQRLGGKHQVKQGVVALANTSSKPWAVVIVLSYASLAYFAVLTGRSDNTGREETN